MLVRVSCRACRLASIWTDDPASFLETVCLRYRHCQARLQEEVTFVPKRPRRMERDSRPQQAEGRGQAVRVAASR